MIGATPEKQSEQAAASAPVLGGRFVLEARLAHGRLGSMYRARDRMRGQDGRPHVSVLILPAEISRNRDQLAAFEEQLEAVSALSHPNIVRIFGLERDGDTTFLVLEWVDAETLRSVLDGLAPETVCEADAFGVVRAVGNALVHAHARGIVHGDIRPENVLITERGEVRLLFTSACLTKTAPFPITPRDDVRGLAALAYEMMSGAPPPIAGLYARDKAAAPQPIDGLGKHRWKALKAALAPRDGKLSTVRRFLAALELTETPSRARAPRAGRASDGRRGSWLRIMLGGVIGAALAAAAVAGFMVYMGSSQEWELPNLPARLGTGADRAAAATREGLADAREQILRASGALAGLLNERGEGAVPAPEFGGSDPSVPAAAPGTSAPADAEARADVGRDEIVFPAVSDDAGGAAIVVETPPIASVESTLEAPTVAEPDEEAPAEAPLAAAAPAARNGESDSAVAAARTPQPRAVVPARVAFSQREYVVSESAGVAAIEIRRDNTVGDLSFAWWTRDGTARSGEDYADLGRSVERFRDGEAAVTVYVPIISDSIVEDLREHFEVHVGVLSADGAQAGALETARVTIVDDDG